MIYAGNLGLVGSDTIEVTMGWTFPSGGKAKACRILVRKCLEKQVRTRPRRRSEDNIKINLTDRDRD
jgi:hypothetical protein